MKNAGGKKTKGRKKNKKERELIDKVEKGQMFGKIVGNRGEHFMVLCSDNIERRAKILAKVRTGPRLFKETFVVVSLREFESEQKNCDIIGLASPPKNILRIFDVNEKVADCGFEFDDSDDDFIDIAENRKAASSNTDSDSDSGSESDSDPYGILPNKKVSSPKEVIKGKTKENPVVNIKSDTTSDVVAVEQGESKETQVKAEELDEDSDADEGMRSFMDDLLNGRNVVKSSSTQNVTYTRQVKNKKVKNTKAKKSYQSRTSINDEDDDEVYIVPGTTTKKTGDIIDGETGEPNPTEGVVGSIQGEKENKYQKNSKETKDEKGGKGISGKDWDTL